MKKTPAVQAKSLKSPRHYRAVIALQQGPQTQKSLMERAGGTGPGQVIAALRKKGLIIETVWHNGLDRDNRVNRYGTYHLSSESAELADHLIEEFTTRGQ